MAEATFGCQVQTWLRVLKGVEDRRVPRVILALVKEATWGSKYFLPLKLLEDTDISYNDHSTSWMQLAPSTNFQLSVLGPLAKWEAELDMFNDLIGSLESDK